MPAHDVDRVHPHDNLDDQHHDDVEHLDQREHADDHDHHDDRHDLCNHTDRNGYYFYDYRWRGAWRRDDHHGYDHWQRQRRSRPR